MQEQKVKVVRGATLQHNYQFNIFINQPVGKMGGSGANALKAIQVSKPSCQLVVKMAQITQLTKKRAKQQIQILRILPQHQNIIKVIPLKIYSQKHSYIFMEYCKDGTLEDLMIRKKCNFTQNQIFDIFYQVINGYKVLYQKKILHQDLKPNNIFIKDGKFKIADFDLSILMNESSNKVSTAVQGTFTYMSLQKLISQQYYANVKSDIYSLGIIFYKLIYKHHPYYIGQVKSLQNFLYNLQKNPILLSKQIQSKFSMQMRQLYQIILRMITKLDKNRINFQEILQFIKKFQLFKEMKHCQQNSQFKLLKYNEILDDQVSQEQSNMSKSKKNKYVFQHQSQSIAIPFDIDETQIENYQNKLKQRKKKQQEQQNYSEICNKIDKYLISKRLIVYFFDRLCRKLDIQKDQLIIETKKRKNQSKSKKISEYDLKQIIMLQKLVLMLIIAAKKQNSEICAQPNSYKQFTSKQWFIYKKKDKIFLKLIKNDQTYLSHYYQDILANSHYIKPKQKQKINENNLQTLQDLFVQLKNSLIDLINQRNSIDPQNRKSIISLVYVYIAVRIINNLKEWPYIYEQFEQFIRIVEIQEDITILINKAINCFKQLNISYSINVSQ